MRQHITLWALAGVITIATAAYQRLTGPTYPVSGTQMFEGSLTTYRLDRSHGGSSEAIVRITVDEPNVRGTVLWKRLNSGDDWQGIAMRRQIGELTAALPSQPPAGKLVYQIRLERNDASMYIPPEPVVIRFKGEVPLWILIPHVFFMFGAMLWSTRSGLEYFHQSPSYNALVLWTTVMLFVGGLILGPLVQLYAFDALWTGWPVGTDLTDNKTAVAFLMWVAAAVMLKRSQQPGRWVLAAAVVTVIVYLIPHSLFGSELDYTTSAAPGG
jgi:hypothetical protein